MGLKVPGGDNKQPLPWRQQGNQGGKEGGSWGLQLVAGLTVLVEELVDGSFLRVEEQRGHVVVGGVGTEELADGGVEVLAAPHLQTDISQRCTQNHLRRRARRPLGGTHCGVEHQGGGQVTALSQKHGGGKNHQRRHHGNQQTLQDPGKGSEAEFEAEFEAGGGLWLTGWPQGSPDELGFGLDVSHAILGQGLVDTVEERPQ